MPKEPWLEYASELRVEVEQAYDEGLAFDREAMQAEAESILALPPGPEREARAVTFHERIAASPMRADFPHHEPSDWPGISACLRGGDTPRPLPERGVLRDRLRGAWYGRICGCLLGKPFEGWRSAKYYAFLKESGQYPLSRYASFDVSPALRARLELGDIRTDSYLRSVSREHIDGMIEDDDTNYTVLALKLIEEKGAGFTPEDVAEFWLGNLPILHVYTAERIAYRNLVRLLSPPDSARHVNPCREWIGAQIRADLYGYINPGRPRRAAEMAWRDASVSHVKNGIYGAMYVAAALALALTENDLPAVLLGALDYIPPASRLSEAIKEAFAWHDRYDFAGAYDALHRKWDERNGHHWCHAVANAQIVVLALLYGEGDFGRTICRAVDLLLDTDCNGATAGSILGALLGERAIPAAWTEPLHDRLLTGVAGYHEVSIAAMAEKTLGLIEEGSGK
ncbi:MAG: ADP-ribosylglycohydrolase family protein [Bacteroidota bacterium]